MKHNTNPTDNLETIYKLLEGFPPPLNFDIAPNGAINPTFIDTDGIPYILDEDSLNRLIVLGPDAGWSPLYWVAQNMLEMLTYHNFHYAKLIHPTTLNSIIQFGANKGLSAAFWLAESNKKGHKILSHDNFKLAQLIDKKTLNYIIPRGKYAGYSVAYLLARIQSGREILFANKHYLGNLIDIETLNYKNPVTSFSIANMLKKTNEGKKLLSNIENNFKETIDSIIRKKTITHQYSAYDKKRAIFDIDDENYEAQYCKRKKGCVRLN